MYKKLLAVLTMLVVIPSFACDMDGRTGFMPENSLYIPSSVEDASMTQEKFNAIIDKVDAVYASVVKKEGGNLVWSRDWENGTVNASAQQSGSTWKVNMYGGLARHPLTTDDGFALVVCHELGHHLGGAPKIGGLFSRWASNEGQADYFGTLKCFREVFGSDDNIEIVSKMNVPQIVKDKCADNFKSEAEVALCIRGAMAGHSLGMLLSSLGGTGEVFFDTPDQSVVGRTNNNHPAGQCRLDTYFQGAICSVSSKAALDNKDPNKGTCNRDEKFEDGLRPLCWFKPGSKSRWPF